MSAPAQPMPAAPAPGQGYSYPISQLPPATPSQHMQPAQPAVPQPGQPGFGGIPAHLAQPQAAAQPSHVPNLGVQPQPGQGVQPTANQPVAAELSMILQGDNLPPQLRGRTVGDVIAQHTMFLNAVRQGGAPQPSQQHVPAQSSMQAAPQAGQQPASNATEFFRDPAAAIRASMAGERQETVNAVLAALAPVLGPVVQSSMQTQSAAAMNTVAGEIGAERFKQLWPHMQQYLASAPQSAWSHPDTWRLAAKAAVGDLVLSGRQLAAQQQPSQAFGTPAAPFAVQQVGPNGQPIPGAASFFTESPSIVQQSGRVQLTAIQQHVFDQMRAADPATWHSPEVYTAWLGGVQPTRR